MRSHRTLHHRLPPPLSTRSPLTPNTARYTTVSHHFTLSTRSPLTPNTTRYTTALPFTPNTACYPLTPTTARYTTALYPHRYTTALYTTARCTTHYTHSLLTARYTTARYPLTPTHSQHLRVDSCSLAPTSRSLAVSHFSPCKSSRENKRESNGGFYR